LLIFIVWNQSERPGAAVSLLNIEVTTGRRNLSGEGTNMILAISDDDNRKKAFSSKNPNGTLFYTDVVENCFFSSIMFGLQYLILDEKLTTCMTKQQIKDEGGRFKAVLCLKRSKLMKETKQFFAARRMNIDDYESGSLVAMKQIFNLFGVQISIFDDSVIHRRVLMWPDNHRPELPQVYVLKTQYPIVTKNLQEKKFQGHYHGLRTTARAFAGTDMQFCAVCARFFSIFTKTHRCTATTCKRCQRPKVHYDRWIKYSLQSKVLYCTQTPQDGRGVDCKCGKTCVDTLCYELHRRTCNHKICNVCLRMVKTNVGKYAGKRGAELFQKFKGHQDCSEVFCQNCNDYVVGFEDLKSIEHTCYVKPIKRSPKHPRGLGSVDLETTINGDVNAAVVVFQNTIFNIDSMADERDILMQTFCETETYVELDENGEVTVGQCLQALDNRPELTKCTPWNKMYSYQEKLQQVEPEPEPDGEETVEVGKPQLTPQQLQQHNDTLFENQTKEEMRNLLQNQKEVEQKQADEKHYEV
jgi:hypothetical protein